MDKSGALKYPVSESVFRPIALYSFFVGLWFFVAHWLIDLVVNDTAAPSIWRPLLEAVFAGLTAFSVWVILRRASRTGEHAPSVLNDEHNLLRTLIDNLPDYIFIKDTASRYVLNNKAHLHQLGATRMDEVSGTTDADYFPEALASQYYDDEQMIVRTGQPLINREEPSLDHDGASIWVATTKVPLRDSAGRVTGLVGIVHNITEHKRTAEALRRAHDDLEARVAERTAALSDMNAVLTQEIAERRRAEAALRKSEKLYRTFVENFPNGGIVLFDRDIRYTLVEGAGLASAGLSKTGVEGKSIRETAPEFRAILEPYFRSALAGQSAQFELRYKGRTHALYTIPIRNENGEIDAGMVMSQDITARKEAEAALLQAHENLEKRVEERTGELSKSNALLKQEIAERKRIESAERQQRALAEALRDTAAAINSTLNFEEVLDRILINLQRVVAHDLSNIMLIEGGVARVVRLRGYTEIGVNEQVLDLRLPVAETRNLQWMIETRQTLVIPDVREYAGWTKHKHWVRSYVGAPINLDGEVIGFLSLDSALPGYFTEDHARRLQAFTDQAAIAIQNARLFEQAQALAVLQERQRLARELHDAVSQTLFSASVMAESLPRLAERNPARVKQGLLELHQLTRGALAEMRTLLLELRPAGLLETPMEDLIRQLVEAVAGRTDMATSLVIEDHRELPPDVQVALYRIVQEALNNVARHAHASHTTVSLRGDAHTIELRIADDGRGFDLDAIPHDHFGIGIMRERADSINATLMINSTIGQGTELVIQWSDQ